MRKILQIILVANLVLGSVFFPKIAHGQFDNTLYNLNPVPQSNLLNPAIIPSYEMHWGIPSLSSIFVGYGNSGIKYHELFAKDNDDSLTINFPNIKDNVFNNNHLGIHASNQWLNYGMKWKDFYFSFSLSDVIDVNLDYSDEIVNLAAYGNAQYIGQTVEIGKTSLKAIHYREYAFGAAWDFDSKWNFGARMKLYFGKSNIDARNIEASLNTDENFYYLTANTNFLVNTSIPQNWLNGTPMTNSEYLYYGSNFGMGIDLGATFKLSDKISLSASVLDLGWIQFDRYYRNYSSDNISWTFEGFDIAQFKGLTDEELQSKIDFIADSLVNKFQVKTGYNKYNTYLNTRLYLAGSYKLSNKEKVGLVMRNEYISKKYRAAVTGSYYYQILDELGVIGSLSYSDRSISNLGLGAYYNLDKIKIKNFPAFQFYLTTDNIFGVFFPDSFRMSSFRFGINMYYPEKKAGRTLIEI